MILIQVLRNDLGIPVWTSGPLSDPEQISRIKENLRRNMAKALFTITEMDTTTP